MASQSSVWVGVFMIKSFDSFLQEDPGYLQGVPLSDEELMFDVSFNATRNVAES